MTVLLAFVYVHRLVCLMPTEIRRQCHPLQLGFRLLVCYHVNAWKQIQVLHKSSNTTLFTSCVYMHVCVRVSD